VTTQCPSQWKQLFSLSFLLFTHYKNTKILPTTIKWRYFGIFAMSKTKNESDKGIFFQPIDHVKRGLWLVSHMKQAVNFFIYDSLFLST